MSGKTGRMSAVGISALPPLSNARDSVATPKIGCMETQVHVRLGTTQHAIRAPPNLTPIESHVTQPKPYSPNGISEHGTQSCSPAYLLARYSDHCTTDQTYLSALLSSCPPFTRQHLVPPSPPSLTGGHPIPPAPMVLLVRS